MVNYYLKITETETLRYYLNNAKLIIIFSLNLPFIGLYINIRQQLIIYGPVRQR